MPWDQIVQLIIQFAPMIIDCFNDDEAAAMQRLRNLGPLEGLRIRRELRQQDSSLSFAECNERVRQIRSALADATDDDLREVYLMAKEAA